jgi:hypothetical protein
MSAPPGANSEYSRGSGPFGRITGRRWKGPSPPVFDSPEKAPERGAQTRPEPQKARPEPQEPGRSERDEQGRGVAATVFLIAACLGALLIVVSQFTALYQLHSATSSVPTKSVGTGANHAWAPIPLALLALLLAFAAYRSGSRVALAALALLGVVTLLIALIGDLPDAHATGLIGSGASQYAEGTSTPSAGLYMETLGAIVLIITGGVGLLLLGVSPQPPAPAPHRAKPA